jgi:hypothetical protein
MLISRQHIANEASIKHHIGERDFVGCTSRWVPREGNKGKRDGILHTRLRRKQRKMQVAKRIDDGVGTPLSIQLPIKL